MLLNDRNTVTPNKSGTGFIGNDAYETYSQLRTGKKRVNIKKILFFIGIYSLILVSLFIFGYYIKNIWIDSTQENSVSDKKTKFEVIKASYAADNSIEAENVTEELSSLFNIPCGVKIISISPDNSNSSILRKNDIIVEYCGKKVTSLEDIQLINETINYYEGITLKIYRNGGYIDVNYMDYIN